jgi:signal transduction histidine kinase
MASRYNQLRLCLAQFLTPAPLIDQEAIRRGRLLNTILPTIMAILVIDVAATLLQGRAIQGVIMSSAMVLIIPILWLGIRRGYVNRVSWITLVLTSSMVTITAWTSGGIRDSSFIVYLPVIMIAGLVLGSWVSGLTAVVTIMTGLGLAYAEAHGLLVPHFAKPYELWQDYSLSIVAITLLFLLALRSLHTALQQARHNERALTELNRQYQAEIEQRRQTELALRQAKALLWRRNQELTLLNQVSQELNGALDLVWVNERLLQAAAETIGAEGGAIWLKEADLTRPDEAAGPAGLVCQAVFRPDRDRSLLRMRLQPGQGLAGWVAQTGQSLIINDVSQDKRFFSGVDAKTGFTSRSLLTIPLQVHDRIIGVLQVINKTEGDFSDNDLVFSETLAGSAATAIQNAQLVEALRQHAQQLERQNEEIDAYAHTVAHDLKTPLARLIGFADFLDVYNHTLSEQERSQHLQSVVQNGRKMIKIIDELLLLAGVSQAKEVEVGPVDMGQVVQEVQARLSQAIEQAQVEIVAPDSWPAAVGYGPWLEEVWANYMSNGVKYGGQPPRLELGAASLPSGQVRFWVRDNGPGLKPNEQERLFTPFIRLDQTRSNGHGLGLSIVRRIVEKLGGQVGVESQGLAGQGCTFWFTLPQNML